MKQEELIKNIQGFFGSLEDLRGSYDHVVDGYKEGGMSENAYIAELLDLRENFTDLRAAARPLRAGMIEAQNNTIDSHRSAYRAQLMAERLREWYKANEGKRLTGVVKDGISLETYDDQRYKDFLTLQSKLKALKAEVDDAFQDIENFCNCCAARLGKTWTRKKED